MRWLWSQASSAARGYIPQWRPSRPARRGASEFACGTLPLCPPLSAAPAAPSAPPRPLMRRPNPAQTLPKPVVGHLPGQQGDAHRRRPLCAAARPHARRQHPSGAPRAAGQGRVSPPNPESVPPAPRLCAPAWVRPAARGWRSVRGLAERWPPRGQADSEHSAIFQCIQGLPENGLRRVILTASGGAFRDWPAEDLPKARGSHRICLENTASRPRFA